MTTQTPPRPLPTTKRPVQPYQPTLTQQPAGTIGIRKPRAIVPRIVIYAGEKFGKTTMPVFGENPVIIMCRDTGYDTLLSAGLVPAIRAAEVNEWTALLATVASIADNPEGCKTFILDGITGAERACHEHVVNTQFNGEWGEKGFLSFHKGYDIAITEWLRLLSALDRLQAQGITVVLLSHAITKTVKNPVGADYDRYEPACHAKTWGATTKWADAILFGKFHTIVEVSKLAASKKIAEQKGKAIGGIDRVLFTTPCDAWVAGNRYNMDSEIWFHSNNVEPSQMWPLVMAQIHKGASA